MLVNTEVSKQIDKYLPVIEEKLAHLDKEELIKHFISTEFSRFLSFYKNAGNLNIDPSKKTSRDRDRPSRDRDRTSRDRDRPSRDRDGSKRAMFRTAMNKEARQPFQGGETTRGA